MLLPYMEGEVSGVSSWCPSSCRPTEILANEGYFLMVTCPSHGLCLEFTLQRPFDPRLVNFLVDSP